MQIYLYAYVNLFIIFQALYPTLAHTFSAHNISFGKTSLLFYVNVMPV